MIDCHAHLASDAFDADREEVLERAAAAGVEAVVCVAEHLRDARRVLELAAADPRLRPCVGQHPEFAEPVEAEALRELIRHEQGRLVGIGEVGLDYWLAREEPQRKVQREVLRGFVALSRETGLPLNVHSRSAGHYAVDILIAEGAERVLMHAFDGRPVHALRGVEAGFVFSIPPSVVRSLQKQKLVRRLPLESLALESDSPVLGPERGVRNEPANLRLAAEKIAELKQRSLDEVLRATTENARRLFGPA